MYKYVLILILLLIILSCQATINNNTSEMDNNTDTMLLSYDCFGEYEFCTPSSIFVNEDSVILIIKKNYNRINSIEDWTDIELIDLKNESTEGGELRLYFNGDTLEKFSVKLYAELGQEFTEYYLRKQKLDFVFRKETKYNTHINNDDFDFSKSSINEVRSYFYDNKSITQNSLVESKDTKSTEVVVYDYFYYLDIIDDSSGVINNSQVSGKNNLFLR